MLDKTRTLQIDTTVELKDYFQAYFDGAKTQLIIASREILVSTVGPKAKLLG